MKSFQVILLFSATLFYWPFITAKAQTDQTRSVSDSAITDTIYTVSNQKVKAPKTKPQWLTKLSPGGNFAMQFTDPIVIDVSPTIGYRLTKRIVTGIGISYLYIHNKTANTQQSVYGGRLFTQYGLSKWVALRAECEALNKRDNRLTESNRLWLINPLAGGGISLPTGKKSSLSVFLLYNFTYYSYPQNRELYNSPWIIRTGISF